jgi:hypothetical protein
MKGKRRFGRVRELASGRWQARYLGPDGKDRPAPGTFATKTDAEIWLSRKEIEIRDGEWIVACQRDGTRVLPRERDHAWS